MLGVMIVRKEELKFREFDRYRGFYCGLCRAIGRYSDYAEALQEESAQQAQPVKAKPVAAAKPAEWRSVLR